MQCTHVKSSWNIFLGEDTHVFYSISFLFNIIGYNLFKFKHNHLGFNQNLLECTYELFLHYIVWGEIIWYKTRNLFLFSYAISRVADFERYNWLRTIILKIIWEIPSWYTNMFCQKWTSWELYFFTVWFCVQSPHKKSRGGGRFVKPN